VKTVNTVRALWDSKATGLAHVENLNAIELMPEWVMSMDGENVPYINLPGYQVKYGAGWSHCPYANWWPVHRQLRLVASWAEVHDYPFASTGHQWCAALRHDRPCFDGNISKGVLICAANATCAGLSCFQSLVCLGWPTVGVAHRDSSLA